MKKADEELSRYIGPLAEKVTDDKRTATAREEIEEPRDSSFMEDYSSSDYERGMSSDDDESPIARAFKREKSGRKVFQRVLLPMTVDAINDREEFIKARVF